MATDKSEPRSGMIISLALLSIGTLIGLRLVLQSYFIDMSESELARKVLERPAYPLNDLRTAQTARMQAAPLPIEQAMTALAGGARPAAIAPQASTDMAPMAGWTQMPRHPAPVAAGALQPNTTPQPAPAATSAGTVGGSTVTPGEAAAGSAFAPSRGDGGTPVAPSTEQTAGPPQTTGTAHPGTGVAQPPAGASPVPQQNAPSGPVPAHAPAPPSSPRTNEGATVPGAVHPAPSSGTGTQVGSGSPAQ